MEKVNSIRGESLGGDGLRSAGKCKRRERGEASGWTEGRALTTHAFRPTDGVGVFRRLDVVYNCRRWPSLRYYAALFERVFFFP